MTSRDRLKGLSRIEHAAVEALFAQDFPSARPASLHQRTGEALVRKGLAEPWTPVIGRDRLGAITIQAWRLTPRGHMLYCAWAATLPLEELDAAPTTAPARAAAARGLRPRS